jgi:hypothetical protein
MVDGVSEAASDRQLSEKSTREHVVLVWILVILGALIGLVSVFAIWLDRVALQTDNYVETTGKLLDDPAIQSALSAYLVDELYARVDVSGEIREQLPAEVQSLAPIIAGGGREAAVVAAKRAFDFPRVQSLWQDANRRVHQQLLLLIDDEARFVSTTGGTVTLEIRPMVIELANRVGLGERVDERLPPDAGNIVLMQSDELGYVQTAVRVLRFLANWLWIFAFVCWGAAFYLARSWRRETVGMIAFAFIVLGVIIVIARGVAGNIIVDELVRVDSNRPAAESAWSIVTEGLRESGLSLVIIGAIGVVGVWLAGPNGAAVSVRSAIAPYIAKPQIAFGALAIAFLVFIWWAPIPGARSPLWLFVFGGLAFIGMALLRRQTMREHPSAETPDVAAGVRDWMTSLGNNLKPATERPQANREADRLDQLERLQSLRERAALSEEEFQAQKTALLHST